MRGRFGNTRMKHARELQPMVPFIDSISIRDVELQLNVPHSFIRGDLHVLRGGFWNPSAKKIHLNGTFRVYAGAVVAAEASSGKTLYFPWQCSSRPSDRLRDREKAAREFLAGRCSSRSYLGPSFRFDIVDATGAETRLLGGPSEQVADVKGKHVRIDAGTSCGKIVLSNGFYLSKLAEGVEQSWKLGVGSADCRRPFIDTLELHGVVLKCGHGNVWWEGHVMVMAGAGIHFGGGNFMFNGSWTIGEGAGKPVRARDGRIVGMEVWTPPDLSSPVQRSAALVQYCTFGRSGAGTHNFGPCFSFTCATPTSVATAVAKVV